VITAGDRNRLRGRVVIVTGSSRGIGRETARLLLDAGATVVLNGRDPDRLEATRRHLSEGREDPPISTIACDVASEEGAGALVNHAIERWGRLDALISNAGVSMRGPIRDLRRQTVEQLVRGNLMSAVLPAVAALPHLEESSGGILFVSTVAAIHGFPGVSVYSATKAAVETFAEALEAESAGQGVSVGTVLLGFVENDRDKTTLGSDGKPFHHERKAMQSQGAAAAAIVRALARRKRRTITVAAGRFLDGVNRLSPGLVARFLRRSGGSVHAVRSGHASSGDAPSAEE
jgi:NAD(P)-dependent dehydrogenase (short-subunit alcohol dehydrogenase family)